MSLHYGDSGSGRRLWEKPMGERAYETQAYRILRTQESKIIDRYRVTDGEKFRLKDHDPADTAGHQSDKPLARALLEGGVQRPHAGGDNRDGEGEAQRPGQRQAGQDLALPRDPEKLESPHADKGADHEHVEM